MPFREELRRRRRAEAILATTGGEREMWRKTAFLQYICKQGINSKQDEKCHDPSLGRTPEDMQ
jgi:hypothetical protein